MGKRDVIESNSTNYELLKIAIDINDIIYVYGPSSSGKTFLTLKALQEADSIAYAYVDCNEIATLSKLYIEILSLLEEKIKIPNRRKKSHNVSKLLGVVDFLSLYRSYVEIGLEKGISKIYIVLDRLSLFRKTPMMEGLIVLASLEDVYLVLITIEEPFDILPSIKSFVSKKNFYDRLFLIQLSPWSKSDIIDTVCLEEPNVAPELYRTFVNNVVSVVYRSYTKDYVEIKSFCQENFPKFHRFYLDNFKEIVKRKEKFTHDLTDEDLDDFDLTRGGSMNIIGTFIGTIKKAITKKDLKSWNQDPIDRKVEFCTSILILAIYVAAYTKPSDDKKNFVKLQKKKVSRAVPKASKELRPFTLERLLHIYGGMAASIQGDLAGEGSANWRSEIPDSVLGDVQELEDIGMLKVVSGDVFSSDTRYKISPNVERDYVDRIAEQIGFSLDQIFGLDN